MADPIGHKDRKKGWGFGRNRPRAYRRDAGYSIYSGSFVFFVAINSSRPASIVEDSNTVSTVAAIIRGSSTAVSAAIRWTSGLKAKPVSLSPRI